MLRHIHINSNDFWIRVFSSSGMSNMLSKQRERRPDRTTAPGRETKNINEAKMKERYAHNIFTSRALK